VFSYPLSHFQKFTRYHHCNSVLYWNAVQLKESLFTEMCLCYNNHKYCHY